MQQQTVQDPETLQDSAEESGRQHEMAALLATAGRGLAMPKLDVTVRATESPGTPESGDQSTEGESRGTRPSPWYNALLCWLGIHEGKWSYVAKDNCTQARTCGWCEKTQVRTKHHREWRYISEAACEQVKTCERCGSTTSFRIRHAWGQTYSVDSSHDGRQCGRCRREEQWDSSYDD